MALQTDLSLIMNNDDKKTIPSTIGVNFEEAEIYIDIFKQKIDEVYQHHHYFNLTFLRLFIQADVEAGMPIKSLVR